MNDIKNQAEPIENTANSNQMKIGDTIVTVTFSQGNKTLMQVLEEYLYKI